MSYSNSFNIGADNLVLGSATGPINISSLGGEDILINGVSPGGGGGGVPAVGDIDFIGNLNCNDAVGGGTKGIITAEKKINSGSGGIESGGLIKTTAAADINSGRNIIFDGQDIYKSYPGIVPPEPNKTYKDYKGLLAATDNITFTGTNKFRNNAVSIQALNTDVPAVFVDKITLNTDGNINCNEINNNTLLKSNSIICENGSPDSQKVMARQYHFRPNSLETTGWVFSQKPPEAVGIPADNYLMLQNTQATGSLNLVKSTFDPDNPTPFDIILDPQNGQVKTATSFDAPQINFRKNAVDNWSISQPPSGDPAEGTLIARSPNTLGSFNIFDSASSPWAQFGSTGTTLPKPTTINNTLNVNGNMTLGSSNSLLFGAYSFRPQQYSLTNPSLRIEPTAAAFTKIFTNSSLFTNVNTGATGATLTEGFYKLSVSQNGASTPNGDYENIGILCDFVFRIPTDATPDTQLPNPLSFSYKEFDTTGAPVIEIRRSAAGVQDIHLTFPTLTGTSGETMDITVKLTKMDY